MARDGNSAHADIRRTGFGLPCRNGKFRHSVTWLRLAMIAGLLSGWTVAARAQAPQGPAPQASGSGFAAAVAIEQALVDSIAKAEQSVVAIRPIRSSRATTQDLFPGRFPGFARPEDGGGDATDLPTDYGTGVIVGAEGLVLTNYHVLGGRREHEVVTINRKTFRTKLFAADPRSDLAVLKVTSTPATDDFIPVTYGDAGQLRKGQIVVALGNPYAIASDGQASASWGIVANLARKAPPKPEVPQFGDALRPNEQRPTLHHYGTLIQTDAKLNLGTSGGALINLQGEMVGLTTSLAAIAGYEQSAGYAIPVDGTFRRIVETLSKGMEVEYGFLGVNLGQEIEARSGPEGGVHVAAVIAGTPAAQARLVDGDVITHIEDRPLFDADDLMLNIGKRPASAHVTLTVRRNEHTWQTEVVLAKGRVFGEKVFVERGRQWRGMRLDYWTATPLVEREGLYHSRSFVGGVAVAAVSDHSPVAEAGVSELMLITDVDGRPVRSPDEFFERVSKKRGPVRLRFWGGDERVIPAP